MNSGVATVDAVVAVGVLHIVKLLVGLHKRFGKYQRVLWMNIVVGRTEYQQELAIKPMANPCVLCWMRAGWKAASAGRKFTRETCFIFPPAPFMPWVPASGAMKSSRPATSPTVSGTGAGSERTASRGPCTLSRRFPFPDPVYFPGKLVKRKICPAAAVPCWSAIPISCCTLMT